MSPKSNFRLGASLQETPVPSRKLDTAAALANDWAISIYKVYQNENQDEKWWETELKRF